MIITITTSVVVDVDSIKDDLYRNFWEFCEDYIPESSQLSDEQRDEIKNRVWDEIVK